MKLSTWIKLWKTYSFREFIFLFSSAILKPRRNLLLHNHVLTRLIDSLSLVDINKDECVVKYKDYELILRPQSSDFFVYNQVILNEEYAPLIEKIIKRKQQETITTIIDLGANIGLSSLYFHFHFPKAIVYALEPVPDNFSLLKKNSLGKDKIVAFHKAIWDSSVDLAMDYSFRDGQAWSITLKPVKYKKEKTIAGITLFQFLEENCIDTIDLLKLILKVQKGSYLKIIKLS